MKILEIVEQREVRKALVKAPLVIRKKYEILLRLILELGSSLRLAEYPGYGLENLSGEWQGCKSVRLNKQWRVIFKVVDKNHLEIVNIMRLTPHDYRRK